MWFRNLTLWPLLGLLTMLVPLITSSLTSNLTDEERGICRDLGFIANSGLSTIKFDGVTQDLLQLVVSCSTTESPKIWCRAQFGGECFCISHNASVSTSGFPENTTFSASSITLLINQSEFRESFAGSFLVCTVKENIHKAYHISAGYNEINTDASDKSIAKQAAVNTIIVCLTSILVCIGPCFVLTFISKWRQEQVKQKQIEGEKERTVRSVKTYRNQSRLHSISYRYSAESQSILSSLKNFKRSTTSTSAGSIFSMSAEFCFKQEKIGCGRFADYWKGIYTGPLPNGYDKNTVCLKVAKSGTNEKLLSVEADYLKLIPPNDHIINYFLTFVSKGSDGIMTVLELAKYGDLYSFLCAKKKAMVIQSNEYWPEIDDDCTQQTCAYVTTSPPKLDIEILELLNYVISQPFSDLLSRPLSELDFSVFAHQIAAGMHHLSSHNIRHKKLTSESVLIFENFVLKISDFGDETSDPSDKLPRGLVIQRNKVIERTTSGRPVIKWHAPEVLKDETYTTYYPESDIWSYGMTLWEIVSYGETPFDDVVSRLLLKAIKENHFPLKPENCSEKMYSLMKSCWRPKIYRPPFDSILQSIRDHLAIQAKQVTQPETMGKVTVEVINESEV